MTRHQPEPAARDRITVAQLVVEIGAQPGPVIELPTPDGRTFRFTRPRNRSDRLRLNSDIRRRLVGETVLIGCPCCGGLVAAEVAAA